MHPSSSCNICLLPAHQACFCWWVASREPLPSLKVNLHYSGRRATVQVEDFFFFLQEREEGRLSPWASVGSWHILGRRQNCSLAHSLNIFHPGRSSGRLSKSQIDQFPFLFLFPTLWQDLTEQLTSWRLEEKSKAWTSMTPEMAHQPPKIEVSFSFMWCKKKKKSLL